MSLKCNMTKFPLSQDVLAKLGSASDRAIAAEASVPTHIIANARMRRAIPSFTRTRSKVLRQTYSRNLIENLTIKDLRALGIGRHYIRNLRKELGIDKRHYPRI